MDKYTVKMFPQAYRDIDKIYGQALLVSNYDDNAIALAEKLEKAILSLEEQPYRRAERKYGFYAFKGYRQLIVENYIIIYEVFENEKVVAVVTVKYGKSEFWNQEISLKYKGDQECQKSDFHQRKEADILFEKREEPFNIYEYCKK